VYVAFICLALALGLPCTCSE